MATELKLRRGTTSQHQTFTGGSAEVTVDTDKNTIVVHDGTTAGGYAIAREDMSNVPNDTISGDQIEGGTIGSVQIDSADINGGTINATNLTIDGSQVYSRDNILGTVSESSGVPTGAIIESGSNSNGEYVKYADGTQICWYYRAVNSEINDSVGSLYRSSFDQFWDYPAGFTGAPVFLGTINEGSGAANGTFGLTTASANETGTLYQFWASQSIPNEVIDHSLTAIGRWY